MRAHSVSLIKMHQAVRSHTPLTRAGASLISPDVATCSRIFVAAPLRIHPPNSVPFSTATRLRNAFLNQRALRINTLAFTFPFRNGAKQCFSTLHKKSKAAFVIPDEGLLLYKSDRRGEFRLLGVIAFINGLCWFSYMLFQYEHRFVCLFDLFATFWRRWPPFHY